MFSPSMTCETSVALTARYCQLLRPLLTSLISTRGTETSPGKSAFPAYRQAGFIRCLRYLLHAFRWPKSLWRSRQAGQVVLTHLTHRASYTVSVRQYRTSQSRFLQCMPRDKPPYDLLTGNIHPTCLWETFTLWNNLVSSIPAPMLGAHIIYKS